MKPTLLIVGLLLITGFFAQAQNVDIAPSLEPSFFGLEDPITITYDVTGTSLENLTEAYIWMFSNSAGLDAPSNINPASSNPDATAVARFSKSTVEGRVLFTINLAVGDFMNPGSTELESIAMILKGNDWSDGQTVNSPDFDIVSGFALKVTSPEESYAIYNNQQTELNIAAETSEDATIDFYVDGTLMETANGKSLSLTHTIIKDGQFHTLRIEGSTATESSEFIHTYVDRVSSLEETVPMGSLDGINYLTDNSVRLVLTAPNRENVFVLGDFNNWTLNEDFQMKKDGDQFWLDITDLSAGEEYIYQYLVDTEITIADPYAEKISSQVSDGEIIELNKYPNLKPFPGAFTSTDASFLQTAQAKYDWKITDFDKPEKKDLIIYELLVRDFTEERSYQAVIDKMDYLDSLGINAIELMPVMEFEGNLSWGYNPSFMFAQDKYYGTEDDLKALIDEAHKRGIAVIFDIVLNHTFGRSPLAMLDNDGLYGSPTTTNPWLNRNATHDFNVGYDFNHESAYTTAYAERVVQYWINEYNIDGYRFDLSKGLTQKRSLGNIDLFAQLDQSRVDILKNIADHVWEADPEAYVILEHFASNEEEKVLSDYGMMLWGNMHGSFLASAKGSSSSINWLYHGNRGWNDPHLIGYFESHDESRLMYNLNNDLSAETEAYRLKRAQLSATFLFMVPGPKMLWQFGEFGYDVVLDDPDIPGDLDKLAVKPTKWEYLQDENKAKLHTLYQSLINLRTNTSYVDPQYFEWNGSAAFKWINIKHPEVEISVVGNFGKETDRRNPNFISTGTWYNYLTGQEYLIESLEDSVTLGSGDFLILTSKKIENYIDQSALIVLDAETQSFNNKLEIFPNPTSSYLNVQFDGIIETIKVFEMDGSQVTVPAHTETNTGKSVLNVEQLKKGIYLIKIETSTGTKTSKFFKN